MGKSLVRQMLDLKNQPEISPKITLSKDQQSDILKGKVILVTDTHYNAKWSVRIDTDYLTESLVKGLNPDYLIIDNLENLSFNPVRQKEIRGN